MTGGQPVDGILTAPMIAQQMRAEGVERIEIVAEDPGSWVGVELPHGVLVRPRAELMAVQRALREVEGVSILIYDQTCATEKRRRRKRGEMVDPDLRIFINELVCEGCGDCSKASNCLSVVPAETEFGRKRQIDQSSCNKDTSCVEGFCPAFMTVEGGELRRARRVEAALPQVPMPVLPALDAPYDVLITGVGGTGIVTIGAILAMAAHLTDFSSTVVDMTGMAQKGGAVLSHVRIAPRPEDLDSGRIAEGSAKLLLACDNVTASSNDSLMRTRPGLTHAVVNDHESITSAFVRSADTPSHSGRLHSLLCDRFGVAGTNFVDATGLATTLLGDAIATNMILLGFAWQKGLMPLPLDALMRAIELNGTAVAFNKRAFEIGRVAAHDPAALRVNPDPRRPNADSHRSPSGTLDEIVQGRLAFLSAYQNAAYARRYSAMIARVREKERTVLGSEGALSEAAARNLFKLMAYKDEYEVARLYTDQSFMAELSAAFEPGARVKVHLALPMLAPRNPETGHLQKRAFGPWILKAFRMLKHFKVLRGTPFDPFGYTEERRTERALITRYEAMLARFADDLTPERFPVAVELAGLPESIRGFGHVKEGALEKVMPRWSELMQSYEDARSFIAAA
jgi:indolepyruvate ferredoxin oxidoreductase